MRQLADEVNERGRARLRPEHANTDALIFRRTALIHPRSTRPTVDVELDDQSLASYIAGRQSGRSIEIADKQ